MAVTFINLLEVAKKQTSAGAVANTFGRPLCHHCEKYPISRPRGLCYRCYYHSDGRREQYVSGSIYARRGPLADGSMGRERELPVPTAALPGSEAKVKVLMERVASGKQLWHPDDAGWSEGCLKLATGGVKRSGYNKSA